MIIENLDYLDAVSEEMRIVSGGSAATHTDTFATYGFGYADANAAASGQQTQASTQTWTNASVSPYVAFTQAYATADAYARTDNSYYWSNSQSISLYLST